MNWDEDLTKALSITRLSLIQAEKCVRLRSSLPRRYYGDCVKRYTCASAMVTKYQKRISDPLLDRIDTAQPYRSTKDGL
jgi:hypothetical protein